MCCSFEILGEILSISDMPSNSIFRQPFLLSSCPSLLLLKPPTNTDDLVH